MEDVALLSDLEEVKYLTSWASELRAVPAGLLGSSVLPLSSCAFAGNNDKRNTMEKNKTRG
jgi:hypothetical protein